jgi:TPR repeat protein
MPTDAMNEAAATSETAPERNESAEELYALVERAFKGSDATIAIRLLGQLAEQGHAPSQNLLGEIYEAGGPVPQDLRMAFH